MLTRRSMMTLGAAIALASRLPASNAAAQENGAPRLTFGEPEPFTPAAVREEARVLAQSEFEPPPTELPEPFGELTYDQYRDIRFRAEAALWRGESLPYEIQLFHRGHVFRNPVRLDVVDDGQSRRIAFTPQLFSYGPLVGTLPDMSKIGDLGFSGFRVHARGTRPDYYDEFAVFQGASYFRAIGIGQTYGLSARGLAIRTAEPDGEEFPYFRRFWIERPRSNESPMVVYALLDSPSTTGAYRFTIRLGTTTVFDVEATLFPRRDLDRVGLAPLTSMFFFSPHDRVGIDDFRPAVHDSDGLLMWNGRNEWLWRPLLNPETLQISVFLDEHPQGFGLMQRERTFHDYQDLEARYETRPSLWVEPIGDWGPGSVVLVEIPTNAETHDNIVSFWRPKAPLTVGTGHQFTYRLHWSAEIPFEPGLARVHRTMMGRGRGGEAPAARRLFVIEFVGGPLNRDIPVDELAADVTASAGALQPPVLQFNRETGGYRASFQIDPEGANAIDLRCSIRRGERTVSEVWVYRWSA